MELILIGIAIGAMSGFFGIGGGMILVPLLLIIGFNIKSAIGISLMQMVFTSIYGSYLNFRKGSLLLSDNIFVGVGGFIGGFLAGFITQKIPSNILKYLFIILIIFALYRLILSPKIEDDTQSKSLPIYILIIVGFLIGIFAVSLGVGGSILLTPILAGILHYPIKKAVSAGLFFVIFSSISGVISRLNSIDIKSGLIIGISSLIGVFIGIWLKEHVSNQKHKNLIIGLYSISLILMINKTFF
jgi:uncharacterized membrane protein YfcA